VVINKYVNRCIHFITYPIWFDIIWLHVCICQQKQQQQHFCNYLSIIISARLRPNLTECCCLFLRAKAATALAHLSQCNSVCPSVCHTGGSVKNSASQDHQIFTVGCLEDSSFRISKAFP